MQIDGGVVHVSNSIIGMNKLNSGQASDCTGVLTSQDYNLIQTTAGCTIASSTSGNKTGVDSLLAPLGDNDGPACMHTLRSNSPALDKRNSAKPGSGIPACEAKDQRGVNRPQAKRCDMGAYERRPERLFTV